MPFLIILRMFFFFPSFRAAYFDYALKVKLQIRIKLKLKTKICLKMQRPVLAAQIGNVKGILVICRRRKKSFGIEEESFHPKSIVSFCQALMIDFLGKP